MKNLLEPQMELFRVHHWLSEIQSLMKHRQTVDLGQQIFHNKVRAKCCLMGGGDFYTHLLTKQPILNLEKGNRTL